MVDAGTAITNLATASSSEATSLPDDATISFEQTPGIAIVKTVDPALFSAPGTATYTYTVTNTGNVVLTSVVVTDDNATPGDASDDFLATYVSGDTDADNKLDLTEVWTFTATRAITQEMVDAGTAITNLATASSSEATSLPEDATISFEQTPGIAIVKTVDPALFSAPGTATYTYTVTNTGNVVLTSVVVTDDNATPGDASDDFLATYVSGDTDTDGQLDLTETWVFTATRAITQEMVDAGTAITNLATASSSEATSLPEDATISFEQTPGIAIVKTVDPAIFSAPGTATYTYSVTNTGNVVLTNVVVTDDNATPGDASDDFLATYVSGDTDTDGQLDLTETWVFTATRAITQEMVDAGTAITNLATASSSEAASLPDDATITFTQTPAIAIVKTVDPAIFSAPGTATYTYSVTNTGNVVLTSVVVTDDNATPGDASDDFLATYVSGDTDTDGQLDLTETWVFTATRAITQEMVDAGTAITNLATASSSEAASLPDDATITFTQTPAIAIVKTVDPAIFSAPGTATYTYSVTNTGNVVLTSVVVTDDNATPGDASDDFLATYVSGDTDTDGQLDLTETWVFTATRAITQEMVDAGTAITNLATASSSEATSLPDDATISFEQTPGIAIVKTVDPALFSAPGTATYTYTVTNTGNVVLTSVVVTDDNATPGDASDDFLATYVSGDTDADNKLDLTEVWTFTATRAITQEMVDAGTAITNLATASSSEATSLPEDATISFEQTPGIAIVKTVDPALFSAPGTATYTYTVTNTGNVVLTNVVVTDDNATPGDASDDFLATYVSGDTDTDGQLDLTETWVFTATRAITQEMVDAGTAITNLATASSSEATSLPDDATISFEQTPGIAIVKTVDPALFSAPGTATYTYTVTNTGNVVLTSVVVTDDNATAADPTDDFLATYVSGDTDADNKLDLTEVWTFTATRAITQEMVDAGTAITNLATASSSEATSLPEDATISFEQTPGIAIVKTVDPALFSAPGTATYTYTVTNTGNVVLTNVVVTDDNATPGDASDDFLATYVSGDTDTDGQLDLTETWVFTATRAITQEMVDAGTAITNLATASSSEAASLPDDATITFTQTPAIAIVKTVDPAIFSAPGTATYTYSVTNTGNVVLTSVVVTDDNATAADPTDDFLATYVSGDTDADNKLDLTEVWTFTATRAITQEMVDAGTAITNLATASSSEAASLPDDATITFTQTPAIAIVKTVDPAIFSAPGTATYTYSVTNTGNVVLTSVVVTDDNATPGDASDDFLATYVSGDTDTDGQLDLTETWVFTATRAITQEMVDAGTAITNLATASSSEATSLPDDATISFEQTPGIAIVKTVDPALFSAPGTATYTYTVTNTGNVVLTSVVVTDDNATPGDASDDFLATYVSGDTDTDGQLDLTETWVFTATRAITQEMVDAGTAITNLATASSSEATSLPDDATISFEQTPGIAIVKTVDPALFSAPGTATYTYTVTNTGNVVLTNVVVTDDNATPGDASDDFLATYVSGDTDTDGQLDLTETWVFTATRAITQEMVDAGTAITNLATASSSEATSLPDDATISFEQTPGIAIVKTVDPALFSAPGTATYTYTVTNTGNVVLTSVVVTDDNATAADPTDDFLATYVSGDTDADNKLDLTEVWTFTATRAITQEMVDAGTAITNLATASSSEATSLPDDATISFTQAPALNILKDLSPDTQIADVAGETITYSITVANIGNVTLTNVVVSDPFATGGIVRNADLVGDGDNDLEVGETWSYTAGHIVTQAELDAGLTLVNTATADSDQTGPDSDDATVPVSQNPALDIVKALDPVSQVADAAGETITYAITVQNTGNRTLTGVTVTDPFATGGIVRNADLAGDNDDLLEVGETWSYTAGHIVTQAELDAGVNLVNTATADSDQTGPDSDDATVPVSRNPALDIVKALAPVGQVADVAGETITYAITVANIGNVTLTNVVVSDPFATGGIVRNADLVGDGDNDLEVGETWSCTAGHIVTQAELDAGLNLVNTATADSDQTGPDSDDASVPVSQNPALDIVKALDPPDQVADVAGESITYTITVQNTGNRTLTGVTVSDPLATGGIVRNADLTGDNDNDLEVGETWSYTATHIVTQAELDAGLNLVNTATADSDQTGPDTDDATVPVGQNPALDVVKALSPADQVADVAGESITYAISVQNNGNQTLTGVTVSDPFATGGIVRNSDVTGDNDDLLEVGEVWSYTATHIVTQGEIDTNGGGDGFLENTVTADSAQTEPDTDDASVPVAQNPALDIVKALDPADQVANVAGEAITYAITVQNSGNRTLTGVTVSDPFATGGIVRVSDITGDNDNLLEVGETWSYTATHIVTQGEIDAGVTLVNVATADSDQTPEDTDDASVPVAQNPALDIVKLLDPADQIADVAGENITYTITVHNTGNRTLTGVTVSDPFATGGIVRNTDVTGDNDNLLEVGEVWSYTAKHVLTQGEIDAGEALVNTATADSDQTGPDSDDAVLPVGQNAALDIVKALDPADQVANVAGEAITYAITVRNAGNQTLTGVTVSDPFATGGISAQQRHHRR